MADYSFIAQPKVPESFQTLGSIMNTARGAVDLQKARGTLEADISQRKAESELKGIELQKGQQANQERLAVQQFMSNPDNFQTNGRIDLNKINSAIPKIAPLTGGEHIDKLTMLANNQFVAEKAKMNLSGERRGVIGSVYGVLSRAGIEDPKVYQSELQNLKTQYPDDPHMHQYIDSVSKTLDMTPPGPAVRKTAMTTAQALLSPEQQQSALSPKAALTDTGPSYVPTIEQPAVGGNPPTINTTGPAITKGLAPSLEKVDPLTGARSYIGPQPEQGQWLGEEPIGNFKGNAQQRLEELQRSKLEPGVTEETRQEAIRALQNQMQSKIGKSVQTSLPTGREEAIAGTVEGMNKHFTSVGQEAQNVGTDVGVLQNIKKFAPGAITGVEADKRAYIAGIAGLLGINAGEIGKTSTDLLMKNANMRALGGNTDAARMLLEGANPNAHMTKEAIVDAANQVIAQRKYSLEKQRLLTPIKQQVDQGLITPEAYNNAVTRINSIDPRIFQLSEMNTEEKKQMMDAMTGSQKETFLNMVREAHKMGLQP